MNINWFPGHMAKTKRLLKDQLQLIDVVIELLDARIPYSSSNPEFLELSSDKPRIIVLNKSDLSDMNLNKQWQGHFIGKEQSCVLVDTVKGKGISDVKRILKEQMAEKIEKSKARGRISRPVRTMVVGIPNVGKSSFINKIVGRSVAITGDKPGVTRNQQWVRISQEIDLLDTPGVLWPKFETQEVAINLSVTGAIKDTVIDIVEVCVKLLSYLRENYYLLLKDRFKLVELEEDAYSLLLLIGKKRGCIVSGGEVDPYRAASVILDEFRSGKIGNITLDIPQYNNHTT